MVHCSKWHVIPQVVPLNLTHQQAHDLDVGLKLGFQMSADLLAARQPASLIQKARWSIPIGFLGSEDGLSPPTVERVTESW
jgi:hypothetical protein